jgi:hypothetical protein
LVRVSFLKNLLLVREIFVTEEMWFRPIAPENEQRRLANCWQVQRNTAAPLEKRYPVLNYPAIQKAASGSTHYVKLASMKIEQCFRNWNSALRFFEENANESDLAQCAREKRALRRGLHAPPSPSPLPSPLPPPTESLDLCEPLVDVNFESLEALLDDMNTSIDTNVPADPFQIPGAPILSPEDDELLRANRCNNVTGYRGVARIKNASNFPFISIVRHDGVRYNLGSHRTAEEAALHAAKARRGLQSVERFSDRWSEEETDRLLNAIAMRGCQTASPSREPLKWNQVANYVGTRTAQQCYRRWEAVDPKKAQHVQFLRDRRRVREAVAQQQRKQRKRELEMSTTDDCISATGVNVGDAPNPDLEPIDEACLRAYETLGPSNDFVDARRQRVHPAHVFVFKPPKTCSFSFEFGPQIKPKTKLPPQPQVQFTMQWSKVNSSHTEDPSQTGIDVPKITDYLLARKTSRRSKAAQKPNAQRVLELAEAL